MGIFQSFMPCTGLGNETGNFQKIKKKNQHMDFYLFIGHK